MTASSACSAGTSSPAEYTCTVNRPPEAAVMRSARRWAPTPRPGKFLGQVVTMRQVWLPCAMAGAARDVAAAAPAPARPAFLMNERRSMDVFLPRNLVFEANVGCTAQPPEPAV